MYLSQLSVNPQSRKARRDLADRYELHRTLMNAYADMLPDYERVLYRVEESKREPDVTILVQSQTCPDWDSVERLDNHYLVASPQAREVNIRAQNGMQLPFRLQANPTVKRDGKRHALNRDEDLSDYIKRKGEQHGFAIAPEHIRITKLGKKFGRKFSKGHRQTWFAAQFEGLLTVTDEALFKDGIRSGIGSAKAFGFGLLSIPYMAT